MISDEIKDVMLNTAAYERVKVSEKFNQEVTGHDLSPVVKTRNFNLVVDKKTLMPITSNQMQVKLLTTQNSPLRNLQILATHSDSIN